MAMGKDETKLSQGPLYMPAGFYLLRAPVLSSNVFLRITHAASEQQHQYKNDLEVGLAEARERTYDELKALLSDPLIEQALMVASADIFEGVARIQKGDTSRRRLERAYAGILRYLVRMSTRPTPFGLFSGVATGFLGAETTAHLGLPVIQRIRTRPDMDWLLSLIQQLEEQKELIPQLHVMTNRTVYLAGGRAIIPYADVYGKGDHRSIALRATAIVRYVLEQAWQPVAWSVLRRRLHETFARATEQQIDGLLQQLWENHFLISDLRPPLTTANPATYVLERLRQVQGAASVTTALEAIIADAAAIDETGAGGSTHLFHRMVERQEQLIANTRQKNQYYQVDTALRLETPSLNQAIGEAVADAAETLLRLGRFPQGLRHLREYAAAFVQRYGMEAEVPLLDLLSPESGLDAPSGYQRPARAYPLHPVPRPDMQNYDDVLCSLLEQALSKEAGEIELTDPLVERLSQWTPTAEHPALPALEMFLQLHASSRAAVDRGEWRGVVTPGCLALGGRAFCRFFDVLGPESVELLQAYAGREEALFPTMIFAELSYLPSAGRGANVAIRPALHAYEIVVNTTPSVAPERVIPLDDLVVGVRGERFYLRSLRLEKEVMVTQSHLLNLAQAPNVCRFLLEVSRDRFPELSSFDWGPFVHAPFLPRVVRKQVVLSPAQWNLRAGMIEPSGSGSEEARWFAGVQRWRERWGVPRYVYLAQFDNRLLLDLEHPLFVRELRAALQNTGEDQFLCLQEMLPDFDHLWLRDDKDAPYIAEIVVPLILKADAMPPAIATNEGEKRIRPGTITAYPQRVITDSERRRLPGEAWTFLKLYASYRQQDEIISRPLREFVSKMMQQQMVDRWFYLHYADPEPHLRVRFHAARADFQERVLLDALSWSQSLARAGLVRRVCVDSYDREIERYGGPEAIDAIEDVFTVDSDAMSELVAALYTKQITLDPLAVAVLTLDQFLQAWGFDFTARLHYTQTQAREDEGSKEFHRQRKLLCELLAPWDLDYDASVKEQRAKIVSMLARQHAVLREVGASIRALARQGALWQPEAYIIMSLAHVHMNRLLGVNRGQEEKVYALWRQALESLQRRPAEKGKKL